MLLNRLFIFFATACLVACEQEGPETFNGRFLDSAVAGLIYRTPSLEGISNESGLFQYSADEVITFSIGDLALPSVKGQPVITPLDLAETDDVSDPSANNIARLLISLDEDADPSNGIFISLETRNRARDISVSDWSDSLQFAAEVASLSSELVSAEFAANHLADTIAALAGGSQTETLAVLSTHAHGNARLSNVGPWVQSGKLTSTGVNGIGEVRAFPLSLRLGGDRSQEVFVGAQVNEATFIPAGGVPLDSLPRTLVLPLADGPAYVHLLHTIGGQIVAIDLARALAQQGGAVRDEREPPIVASISVPPSARHEDRGRASVDYYLPAKLSPMAEPLLVRYFPSTEQIELLRFQ